MASMLHARLADTGLRWWTAPTFGLFHTIQRLSLTKPFAVSAPANRRRTSTAKGERRYRYYVCRTGRDTCAGQSVAAPALEASVLEQLESLARQPAGKYVRKHLKPLGPQWRSSAHLDLLEPIRRLIERVSYDATTCGVTIRLRAAQEKRHDAAAQ
jgi:hypothetical protein